jgi:NADH-quinone oxidoreductase subunit N
VMSATTTLLWLQFLPLLLGGLVALGADAFERRRTAIVAAALGLATGGLIGVYAGWTRSVEIVYDVFLVGSAFSTIPGMVGLLGSLAVVGGAQSLLLRRNGGTLAALVAFAAFAGGLAACSIDFIALIIVLETAALAAYALVSAGSTRKAEEAAIKYYVQGAVATGLLVLGVAVLVGAYASSGSYVELISVLSAGDRSVPAAVFGMVFVVAALAFKTGAAPFHPWAPDAYQHARPESAAFLAGPLKGAFLFVLVLLLATVAPVGATAARPLGLIGTQLLPVVGVLGVLSVLVGSLAALRQRSYLRMLGYAGVAQVGYAFVAASAVSTLAVAVFATTYAVAATGAFLAAVAFRTARPDWDGSIDGLAGIYRSMPVLSGAVAVLMASLAGLPPLFGFWGKFQVLVAAISVSGRFSVQGLGELSMFYGVLAAVALTGSVVSIAYYGRVIRAIFSEGDMPDAVAGRSLASSIVVLIAVITLVLGLAPLFTGLAAAMTGFQMN